MCRHFEHRFKRHISAELSAQLVRIEQVLNACAERHLAEKDLTMEQLNSILRAFTNRQSIIDLIHF